MNIKCLSDHAFLWYMPRNGVAGSYSSSIFSFLRTLYTVLLVAVQIYVPGSILSPPSPALLFVDFLMIAILTGMRWYLIVILIFISLIITNVEHLFMCLLSIFMSSLEKYLFRSSAHFFHWIVDSLMLFTLKVKANARMDWVKGVL